MASRSINITALMTAIVLAIFILVFGVLAFMRANEVSKRLEGKDGVRSIAAERKDLQTIRETVQKKEELVEADKPVVRAAVVAASEYGIQADDAEISVGVGTPDGYGVNPRLINPAGNPTGKIPVQAPPLGRTLDSMLGFVTDVNSDKALLEANVRAAAGDGRRYLPLRGEIVRCQEELGKLLERVAAEEKRFKDDQGKRNEELDVFTKLANAERKRFTTEANLRENRINQREDEIRRLLELELKFATSVDPVGALLEVVPDQDRVVIDLGAGQRARPGLLFDVFQYDKGRYVEKGRIEIIEVGEATSIARVLVQNDARRNPFAKGDRIGNPLFNTRRPKVFVLAGDFLSHNLADYEHFIRAMGNEVRREIEPDVDFLVVRGDENDRSNEARARAREFKVLGLTEERLLRYIPRTFPTVPRRVGGGATRPAAR